MSDLKASQVKEWQRVIITGCRTWRIDEFAITVVRKLQYTYPGLVIVHGGCTGVDFSFYKAARSEGANQDVFLADWEFFKNPAGPIRNKEMVDAGAVLCLAFHKFVHNSKGTRGCMDLAMAAGIPTWLADSEGGKPVRQYPKAVWDTLKTQRWGDAVKDGSPGVEV